MAILYLTEQQAWVGREGDCLIVHIPERDEQGKPMGKRERKMTIPLFKVEEVVVLGEITITTPALTRLLEARVPVTYLSKYGRYLGGLNPILTKNSILRLAQHSAYADGARRHTIAQRFVIGKLRNMRTILMRYARQCPLELRLCHTHLAGCQYTSRCRFRPLYRLSPRVALWQTRPGA